MSLEPELPNLELPGIRDLPAIPGVGCAGGSATTFTGSQFGGLPDLQAVLHIKALKKQYQDMMATLIEGYVPAAARQPVWAVRVANYVTYVASLVEEANALIQGIMAEVNASIAFVNGKISELNAAKNDLLSVPAETRSLVQAAMIERYTRYTGELQAQAGRLQSTLDCIGVL
jgi:hypothetical protein